jgi:SH3 domain-containing YSC84-like protein 1
MKRHLVLVALSVAALLPGTMWAASLGDDASNRLKTSATVLKEIASNPDKGIPQDVLAMAKCIVVIPHLVKAGLLVGGKYGRGIAVCRTNGGETHGGETQNDRAKQAAHAHWSAPAFITIGGGSVGLQIGAEGVDLVMLVMNDKGLQQLLSSKFEFSVEGSVAAGPVGSNTSVGSNPNLNTQMLIYSLSKGAFVGQTLEGAVIEQDRDTTKAVYGSDLPFNKILLGQTAPPASAAPFLHAGADLSHQAGKQRTR